ncbi:MAG: FHA domain-containing protein [Pseudomonadota bacterium]
MSIVALHLNDTSITALDASSILYREPGVVLLEDDGLLCGNAALALMRVSPRRVQNQYWSALGTDALADRRFQHLSAADLAGRQLEDVCARIGNADRVVVAVPAYMTNQHLGLFLGIAKEWNLPVAGLVDAAVAATRREYRDATPVHIDISLHSTTLTRLQQPDRAQADRSEVVEGTGILALLDAWLRVVAEAFVQQSRFDPLHTAQTEQLIFDRLIEWLFTGHMESSVSLEIESRGITHTATVESLELIAAAAPIYQTLISRLRALIRADETVALQLTDRAGRMPGLADMLRARVGGEVFLLEPGATARGLLTRCKDMQAGTGGISLVRNLPWDQSALTVEPIAHDSHGGRPTHLLFDNMAYLINEHPLSLGSQTDDEHRAVDLGGEMPGVSRRHCTVRHENGQCIVRDFSRYGTFLNGHAIDGSAVLQVGDQLRLGTPGYELRLIVAEAVDGA